MPVFSKPLLDLPIHPIELFTNAYQPVINGGHFNVTHSPSRYHQRQGIQCANSRISQLNYQAKKTAFKYSRSMSLQQLFTIPNSVSIHPRCHEHTREAVLEELFD